MKLSDHIAIVPGKRFGKPILIGTRIAVADVLNWLANGMTTEQILLDFPELTELKIRACLHYAANWQHQLRLAS